MLTLLASATMTAGATSGTMICARSRIARLVAGALALVVLVVLSWLAGDVQRTYRFGRGRQEVWGFHGHSIRGARDEEGVIWLSVDDCAQASGLDLQRRLSRVPPRRRARHRLAGVLLAPADLREVVRLSAGDSAAVSRFLAFLEREVWRAAGG